MKGLTLALSVVLISCSIVGCCGLTAADSDLSDTPPNSQNWTVEPNNPILKSDWALPGDLLLNDPSVMKEGAVYHMWYSKGSGLGVNHVRIYEATSTDGITWTEKPNTLLEPDSDITVTGTNTSADISGVFEIIGEMETDFTNGKPAYKLNGQNWYLWYDASNGHYRLSDVLGADGTASWSGNASTIVDGVFNPHSGTATGTAQAQSDWDSEKTETPNVIKVDGTYHMYYSGFKTGDGPGRYQTGHATSTDGVVWVKDPANPVLAYHDDPSRWMWYQAAEPGAVYNPLDSKIYLYFTTAIYRGAAYDGTPFTLQQGIGVATSTDGSLFTFQGAALTQSASYPAEQRYVGYSTPFAFIGSDGLFHLFYDVASFVTDDDWRQVAIAHATSNDGLTFTEIETDIAVYNTGNWHTFEVRAPSVLEEDGLFKMWFAGNNALFFRPEFVYAIGYAERATDSYDANP